MMDDTQKTNRLTGLLRKYKSTWVNANDSTTRFYQKIAMLDVHVFLVAGLYFTLYNVKVV